MKPNPLSLPDLLDSVTKAVTRQAYAARKAIDGVVLDEARVHRGSDGAFAELLRLDEAGDAAGFESFRPVQWNWSVLEAGAVKAWHLHLSQDDLWIVPPTSTVLVGLVDLRRASPTVNESARLALGGGTCHRLWIPRGVAHGVANLGTTPQSLIYAMNQLFRSAADESDEWRLPADHFGAEFWQMDRN